MIFIMPKIKSITIALVSLLVSTQVFANENLFQFPISGTSSVYGDYEGTVQIEVGTNKVITKEITYKNFHFEHYSVTETWVGSYKESVSTLKNMPFIHEYNFQFKKADKFLEAEGEKRDRNDFKEKVQLSFTGPNFLLHGKNDKIHYSYQRNGNEQIKETWDVQKLRQSPKALWVNQRVTLEDGEKDNNALVRFAMKLLENKVIDWFHDQPEVKAYEGNPRFDSRKTYYVKDTTDYEFYKNNPKSIRVTNKFPDKISLIEEVHTRNAYAPSLSEKNSYFESQIESRFLNEFGFLSDVILDEKNQFKFYQVDWDSALWSGMFLASQGMRYELTKDDQAFKNIERVLKGIIMLTKVNDSPEEFARVIHMKKNTEASSSMFVSKTLSNNEMVFLPHGNNDMFKGLVLGLLWAYKAYQMKGLPIPEDLRETMLHVQNLKIAKKSQNKIFAEGLHALVSDSPEQIEKYIRTFYARDAFTDILGVRGYVHHYGIYDWSGLNLSMVSNIIDITLSEELIKKYPEKKDELAYVTKEQRKELLYKWKDSIGTRRDFITIAAYTYAVSKGVKPEKGNERLDSYSRKDVAKLWKEQFAEAVWYMREIPMYKKEYNILSDLSARPEFSISHWPYLPWKSAREKRDVQYHIQSATNYPQYEHKGFNSNFVMKDHPFSIAEQSWKNHKTAGADFVFLYWMSRYGGLNWE